jgi:DNA-binding Xre family transcriptional regulator
MALRCTLDFELQSRKLTTKAFAAQIGISEASIAKLRAEWTTGSAVAPGIAEQALDSLKGSHQVLGFLNPAKLGRNLGYATKPVQRTRALRAAVPWWLAGIWPCATGRRPHGAGHVQAGLRADWQRSQADQIRKASRQSAPVPYFAPLDATSYEAIAARAGLTPPAFVSSWSAWLWLLAQPAVELCIDEGEKKAAAACSHGFLTIGLAGIWNGCPKPKDAAGVVFGAPTLIAELQWLSIRPKGAPLTIAFDASESRAVALQSAKLGAALAICCSTPATRCASAKWCSRKVPSTS